MWARYVQILAYVEPDRLNFLVGHLNLVLKAQYVASLLERECRNNILKLNLGDIVVLLRQDENVAVRILQQVIILDEVLADYGYLICAC